VTVGAVAAASTTFVPLATQVATAAKKQATTTNERMAGFVGWLHCEDSPYFIDGSDGRAFPSMARGTATRQREEQRNSDQHI